jgi:hypothetical protein
VHIATVLQLDADQEYALMYPRPRWARKLIRECAKLKNFLGHLPEIAIDERYLENLRLSKMSSADKAEKIIRDIETIIRREEARNPAYVDLDVRLQELIERKKDLSEDIEQILLDLETLYGEVDEVGNLPKRMGFEDRGRFDLFLDIRHATGAAFDETKARQFVDVLVAGLMKGLYAGWQESDQECRRIETDIKALALMYPRWALPATKQPLVIGDRARSGALGSYTTRGRPRTRATVRRKDKPEKRT